MTASTFPGMVRRIFTQQTTAFTINLSFGFIVSKTLNSLAFQSFDFQRHLMKVILETRRAYLIWNHCRTRNSE
jgi:hypothetical protein